MKHKLWCAFATFLLLVSVLVIPASAVDHSQEFLFSLSVNGEDTVNVEPGDIITVMFRLERIDRDEAYTMYAMQNQIRYDSTFFELVEGSVTTNSGIMSTDIALVDQYRELYMSFLSMSGGAKWDPDMLVGSFQLRVIGNSGVTSISNQDYLVSLPSGEDVYAAACQDVTAILSSKCTVKFETNGGSEIGAIEAYFGEYIPEPQAPVRDGYTLEGWYSDIFLQKPWDFAKDTVQGNITLYAKWIKNSGTELPPVIEDKDPETGDEDPATGVVDPETGNKDPETEDKDPATEVVDPVTEEEAEFDFLLLIAIVAVLLVILILLLMRFGKKTVRFNACGGSPVEAQKLRNGERVTRPIDPVKPNAQFEGWYNDRNLTNKWDFEKDTVKKNMTLYARWK